VSSESLIAVIGGGLFILGLVTVLTRRPKRLDKNHFNAKWTDVQKLCKSKDTWPLAIINGDKLLDEALKKRHFKGKTMGERLVSAQRQLSDNDGVWFAHKLRNQLVHEDSIRLVEKQVKQALVGIRQGLRDLGAL
jgi:hypothetical protein